MAVTPWATTEQVRAALGGDPVPNDELLTVYAQIASNVLSELTNKRFYQPTTLTDVPVVADSRGRLWLGDYQPVASVSAVSVDTNAQHGTLLPASLMLEPDYLANATWSPLLSTEYLLSPAHTFVQLDSGFYAGRLASVTFIRGHGLPSGAAENAAMLAAEMLKRDPAYPDGGEDLSVLPKNVTSISRQGVTFQFENAKDILGEGRVGIFTIDLWIRSMNQTKTGGRPPRVRVVR